jgi:TonB family protein
LIQGIKMEMRKPLALSVFMHFILLSAALFLLKGSRALHDEEIFFVRLAEDIKKTDTGDVVTGIEIPSQPPRVKEEATRPLSGVRQRPPSKTFERLHPGTAQETTQKTFSKDDGAAGERPDMPAYQEYTEATHTEGQKELDSIGALNESGGDDGHAEGRAAGQQTVQSIYSEASYLGDKKIPVSEGVQGSPPPGVLELIGSAIERVKVYPALARKRGIEGTVYISFRIDYDGKPEGISILRSSGFGILDAATVDVVRKAAPFPRVERRVEIPVTYRLKD